MGRVRKITSSRSLLRGGPRLLLPAPPRSNTRIWRSRSRLGMTRSSRPLS